MQNPTDLAIFRVGTLAYCRTLKCQELCILLRADVLYNRPNHFQISHEVDSRLDFDHCSDKFQQPIGNGSLTKGSQQIAYLT